MIFGCDIEINLPNNNIIEVGFNYELGVLKVSNEQEIIPEQFFNPGMKNQAFTFNVSYLFNVNKKNSKNNNNSTSN